MDSNNIFFLQYIVNKFPEDLVSLKPKDRKIPLLIAIV